MVPADCKALAMGGLLFSAVLIAKTWLREASQVGVWVCGWGAGQSGI